MKRVDFRHGFSDGVWNTAKEEARQVMIKVASRRGMIPYSDLVSEIKSCILEPHDPRLDHLLGQIAEAEDEAARGLLTVVVVHKTGDKIPGPGFFKMAQSRGRDTSDPVGFWIEELQRVHDVWS